MNKEIFNSELEPALTALRSGGVILYPTDTVWGLGCDATNCDAVQKLIGIKGKQNKNGLIVLLASERDILQYVTQPDLQVFDYLKTILKPTTVIYEGGIGVCDQVLAADGTIAIRLVQDEFCRHLVKRFRKPVVSTSANFHGEPAPENFLKINDDLKLAVDHIVGYRQADFSSPLPSSIIKWVENAALIVIRP